MEVLMIKMIRFQIKQDKIPLMIFFTGAFISFFIWILLTTQQIVPTQFLFLYPILLIFLVFYYMFYSLKIFYEMLFTPKGLLFFQSPRKPGHILLQKFIYMTIISIALLFFCYMAYQIFVLFHPYIYQYDIPVKIIGQYYPGYQINSIIIMLTCLILGLLFLSIAYFSMIIMKYAEKEKNFGKILWFPLFLVLSLFFNQITNHLVEYGYYDLNKGEWTSGSLVFDLLINPEHTILVPAAFWLCNICSIIIISFISGRIMNKYLDV